MSVGGAILRAILGLAVLTLAGWGVYGLWQLATWWRRR